MSREQGGWIGCWSQKDETKEYKLINTDENQNRISKKIMINGNPSLMLAKNKMLMPPPGIFPRLPAAG